MNTPKDPTAPANLLIHLGILAQQHPSTPLRLEVDFIPDAGPIPHWEASCFIQLEGDEIAIIAEADGRTAIESLERLVEQMLRAPVR